MPQIRSRIDAFKKELMGRNREMQQNYQYGLANRDVEHLATSSTLSQTALIIAFTSNQKKSQSLSTNLKIEQKQAIRGYLQLEAEQLRSNGTIT